MTTRHRAPLHPGEVLLEEVVKPLDMSVNQLALALGIGATRLNEVVQSKQEELELIRRLPLSQAAS